MVRKVLQFSFICQRCGYRTVYKSGAILHVRTCGKGEPIAEKRA